MLVIVREIFILLITFNHHQNMFEINTYNIYVYMYMYIDRVQFLADPPIMKMKALEIYSIKLEVHIALERVNASSKVVYTFRECKTRI